MLTKSSLTNRRILVAEDDGCIAFEIGLELAECGAEVIGPICDLDTAFSVVDSGAGIDAAVLDLNLQGELIFPLVDHLIKKNIPLVFATAYAADVIPYRLRHLPRLEKPVHSSEIASTVANLMIRVKLR